MMFTAFSLLYIVGKQRIVLYMDVPIYEYICVYAKETVRGYVGRFMFSLYREIGRSNYITKYVTNCKIKYIRL
jgi:hypothetical protein